MGKLRGLRPGWTGCPSAWRRAGLCCEPSSGSPWHSAALRWMLNKQSHISWRGDSRYHAKWDVLISQLLPECIYTRFSFFFFFFFCGSD